MKEIGVSEMTARWGWNLSTCASSSTTSSPGNLRRGQSNEEGKPNECGAGSDQRVGKIAVSCSEPVPDLLERIHHRLAEGWSAMPYDSADRIAREAARCWTSVRMTPLWRGSGVRYSAFPGTRCLPTGTVK
jgi:hypothetical protein